MPSGPFHYAEAERILRLIEAKLEDPTVTAAAIIALAHATLADAAATADPFDTDNWTAALR